MSLIIDPYRFATGGGAAPAIVDTTSAAGDGSTGQKSTLTIAKPTGSGGTMWAFLGCGHQSGNRSFATATDWTLIESIHGTDMPGSADQDLRVYRFDGTEGAETDYTFTTTGSANAYVAGVIARVSDAATVPDASGTHDSDTQGSNNTFLAYIRAPSLMTSGTNRLILFAGTWYDVNGSSTTVTPGAGGYTEYELAEHIVTNATAGDDAFGICLVAGVEATAGTYARDIDFDSGATRQWLSAAVALESA